MTKKLLFTTILSALLASFFAPAHILATSDCIDTGILARITELTLQPNSHDHFEFYITNEAEMPNMSFDVSIGGDFTEEELGCVRKLTGQSFDWRISVQYWDGTEKDSHKILPTKLGAQRSGFYTGDGWQLLLVGESSQIEISLPDWGNIFGGGHDGTVEVSLKMGERTLVDSLPLRISGTSIDKTQIKKYLGALKYQLLGYLESKFIHIYNGIPLLNCGDEACSTSDGGFGLMQITDCTGAIGTLTSLATKTGAGHGYPSYSQIWNWKANADAGKSCFDLKANYFCSSIAPDSDPYLQCGYTYYNGSSSYGELGITILNEMRTGRFRAGWFE